ncbi:MAG: TraB/GumN family protein [Candidatus Thermoplasmatota archaeon]|nr:TraB/GumN family protein [Candidatus Thermoplasmatota archaeon]
MSHRRTMITLIGTGHVFDLSNALLAIFEEKQPDILCVELDEQRYQAFLLRSTNPAAYQDAKKNLPLIYRMLAQFQDSVAQQYGVQAGDEMLTAITYAQSHQLPVGFIDTDAQALFIHMWRTMPFFEKLKLLLSGFTGFFVNKQRIEHELAEYQKDLDGYLEDIGKKYPTIKKTLIDDRNIHMVNRLSHVHATYQRIIACVGDGHVPGISALLTEQQIPFETIRLQELQTLTQNTTGETTGHFSVTYSSSFPSGD